MISVESNLLRDLREMASKAGQMPAAISSSDSSYGLSTRLVGFNRSTVHITVLALLQSNVLPSIAETGCHCSAVCCYVYSFTSAPVWKTRMVPALRLCTRRPPSSSPLAPPTVPMTTPGPEIPPGPCWKRAWLRLRHVHVAHIPHNAYDPMGEDRSLIIQYLSSACSRAQGADRGLAFTSGMAALAAVCRLCGQGDHIVAGDDLYGGTSRLLSMSVPQQGEAAVALALPQSYYADEALLA